MCFYTTYYRNNKEVKAQELTAKKNIVCYKVLNPTEMSIRFISEYRGCSYILGKKNPTVSFGKIFKTIHQGYHSYTSMKYAIENKARFQRVIECIIPKGSKYYKNIQVREYCSNQIILKKIIK